jgi:hypothetical protein
MILTGADRLAGCAIWFFLFSILHAARLGRGAMFVLLELTGAALLAFVMGRLLPEDDDGRRLPRAGSTMIIMLGFVILASAAFGALMSDHAAAMAATRRR